MLIVPPSVKVDNQLVGCPVGETVKLQCFVESSPREFTYWRRKSNGNKNDELILPG